MYVVCLKVNFKGIHELTEYVSVNVPITNNRKHPPHGSECRDFTKFNILYTENML